MGATATAVRVSVTGTEYGELVHVYPLWLGIVITVWPVYVPAPRPAVLTATSTELPEAVVELAGDAESHGWSVATLYVALIGLLVVTANDLEAIVLPVAPENDSAAIAPIVPGAGGVEAGLVPVPLKAIEMVLPVDVVNCRVPEYAVAADGLKVTAPVRLCPGFKMTGKEGPKKTN